MSTTTAIVPPVDIRPESPEWYHDDVYRAYSWLRDEAPLFEYQPRRFLVSRYEDLREVSASPNRFSSARGILVSQGPMEMDGDGGTSPSIIMMDPPEHNTFRKIVSRAFTPRAVRGLEPRIREIARQCLDEIEDPRRIDIVDSVAVPLPVLVIAELLGIPEQDRMQFKEWSDAVIEVADEGPEAFERVGELLRYFASHIDRHRREPQDDILSKLVEARVDGRQLDEQELEMFCLTLLVAGNETTRNLISGGCLALMEHPDQLELLAARPALAANAVEEMLRWVTPVMSFARTVTGDDHLGTTELRPNDYLVLLYGSANRDERTWGPGAANFDIEREVDPSHVAFGFGEHHCLGAALARLEARIMFEELLARYPKMARRGDPRWLASTLMNSLVELPVELSA